MTDEAIKRYFELVRKVDEFAHNVMASNAGNIACSPGCDECCRKSFTVFRIEAHNLFSGFGRLGAAERGLIEYKCIESDPARSACVLLEDGHCMLYEYRPIICRTHGLPFTSSHISINGASTTSLCDRNFTAAGSLDSLQADQILNLDTLNAVLSAVNMLYMKGRAWPERALNAGQRLSIPDIFTKNTSLSHDSRQSS